MTSTPVKDVGSVFMNLAVSQAAKSNANAGGFQEVWNNRMNNGAADNAAADRAARSNAGRQLQRGASLKARESRPESADEPENLEELSPEDVEKAAEILGTAALELMQQIADAFGITMEQLQEAMDGMGLEQMDILDASQLGALILTLGGAEDTYALITDGELYESYRALMEQLEGVLKESADALEMQPEQLGRLLEEGFGKEISAAEEQPREMLSVKPEELTGQEAGDEAVTPVVPEETVSKEQEATNQNGAQSKGEEKASEGKSGKEEPVNLFVQNLRTEQFQPNLQQAGNVSQSSSWSAETQKIMDQILDYMKIQLSTDVTSLEMQLHPASLGTLQIQIASKAGVVTANFITQNEAVKAALESQMVQLKEQFEEQGVKVEAIEVTVQTHEFERNLDEQGRGRGGQEPEKKNRTRRINLNDSLTLEGLEEEEALAADMLAAGGSTVDYTA